MKPILKPFALLLVLSGKVITKVWAALQKSLFAELLAEVKNMQAEATDDTVVTIGQIIANNKLRDKILKAEQTVFELKARINQLLSKAS